MKYNLLFLLLILNLFINLSNQIDFGYLKPFDCEEIDKNLNYFKNEAKFIFIIKNDFSYLILKNRKFAFKNFYFGDYDESNQSDELIVGHPFIDKEESVNKYTEYEYYGSINNDEKIYLSYRMDSENYCIGIYNEREKFDI